MNTNKIYKAFSVIIMIAMTFSFTSCDDELVDNSFENGNTLEISVSNSVVVLEEQFFNNNITFNWTKGSNQNTGSAIKYTLEVDLSGNDFSNPLITLGENVQNKFSHVINYGDLNNYLLENGLETKQTYELTARVIAKFANTSVETQTATTNFSVTTFKPVSNQLFIVGDATPNGWDISNATQMMSSTSQRGVFTYTGDLSLGNFKFPVNQDGCWCQDFYTKDPNDDAKIVYNEGGSGGDLQWTVETELGPDEDYHVTVDLLNLSIKIEIVESTINTPLFSNLYIVGDASESGWNVDTPVAFSQNSNNPFIFSYEGLLSPGNFKILAGALGDFCGEWYRPSSDNMDLTSGSVEQNSGCDVDNKWLVTESSKGRYKITVDTQTNLITFNKIMLYIVGDGGPNGWNINNPAPMSYINGEYVFVGPLGESNPTGEFKISKFVGDWCDGDWINPATASQSINNTNFINTTNCDGPDNKWKLKDGEAGNYEIRINLETQVITITKQ